MPQCRCQQVRGGANRRPWAAPRRAARGAAGPRVDPAAAQARQRRDLPRSQRNPRTGALKSHRTHVECRARRRTRKCQKDVRVQNRPMFHFRQWRRRRALMTWQQQWCCCRRSIEEWSEGVLKCILWMLLMMMMMPFDDDWCVVCVRQLRWRATEQKRIDSSLKNQQKQQKNSKKFKRNQNDI
jgi:hypothetical protein